MINAPPSCFEVPWSVDVYRLGHAIALLCCTFSSRSCDRNLSTNSQQRLNHVDSQVTARGGQLSSLEQPSTENLHLVTTDAELKLAEEPFYHQYVYPLR